MRWWTLWTLCGAALAGCAIATLPVTGSDEERSSPGQEVQAGPGKEPTASPDPVTPTPLLFLEDFGPAPELVNEVWLNTAGPLRLTDLRGRVVLLEMWTFGCINCQHVIPSLRDWHERYSPQGLVVIGNHYPEFSYERDLDNLKEAVSQLGIAYPVAQDNDGATWRAYRNRYWPTLYLIDKRGDIRYQHIGEGSYEQTERAILALLAEPYH